ncbi:class III cytochrome C family protein [Bradyrhizobium sp. INPA_01384B]|uniref:Class III cytochrome C family protein n=1 Tax=Bradyrhizobium campsiandrae TaxID=1729892 RepID=A0ABR7U5P0_9BRAD|nr:class III cytochrome C family protein [Bradyrhizobium campsiandrae]
MTIRSVLYVVAATLAVASAAVASIALYQGGSGTIPGWTRLVNPGPLSGKHAFLSETCESCHTPTRGVDAAACISCHGTAAADLGKPSTAFHAAAGGQCSGCHREHAGELRPIRMNHASLLQLAMPPSGTMVFDQSAADQMTADLKEFLGLPKSEQREQAALDCANCHSNREPHRALFGRNCADCHGLTSWKVAGFLHPSPTSRDCAQCHQAPPSHYMGHFIMMDRTIAGQEHASVEQCFLCHRTDSFNDIKGVGWMKHH